MAGPSDTDKEKDDLDSLNVSESENNEVDSIEDSDSSNSLPDTTEENDDAILPELSGSSESSESSEVLELYEEGDSSHGRNSGDNSDSGDEPEGRANLGISNERARELLRDDYRDFRKDVIANSEVVETYELSDYSHIEILYNSNLNETLFRAVEPELTEFEETLRIRVSRDIEEEFETLSVEDMTSEEMADEVERLAAKHLDRQKTFLGTYGNKAVEKINQGTSELSNKLKNSPLQDTFDERDNESLQEKFEELCLTLDEIHFDRFDEITEANFQRVMYYVKRDYARYEKLTPIMQDKGIEDISCNGPDIPIFVYHRDHQDLISNVMYKSDELDDFVAALAQRSGKHISIAEPDLQGRLPDGSRMQLTYSDEISSEGSNFTLRKFKEEPFTPVELVEFETFSLDQMAYLWLAIENDQSLIFAGGTASGKTTSMNAISLFIPPRAKIVSIEDTREITLRHDNWIRSVTRESFGSGDTGEVGMYSLLRHALRQRPEYLVVGEIRGEEARTLFQAMSTGHTTYSTMHAEDVPSAIRRLENEPINLPRQMLNSLDILSVQIRTMRDGEVIRRCKEMVEIVDIKSETNEIEVQTVFEYNPENDTIEYKGESEVLERVKRIRNMNDRELNDELQRRMDVLRYLRDEVETRDYNIISGVLRTYMQEPESIMTQIEEGTLLKNL